MLQILKGIVKEKMANKADNKFKAYMTPAFLICAIVLAVACASKKVVLQYSGAVLAKIPIELRKSFDLIDESKLGPYKVVDKSKIKNKEVLESLGTEDYIQWILEDTGAGEFSPVRFCSLFITYYGKPDKVPHVPEECYVGSGNEKRASQSIALALDGNISSVDARKLVFAPKNTDIFESSAQFSRLYFFKVNDEYAHGRGGVREALGKNLFGEHSYFSKVEWEFFGSAYGRRVRPRDEGIKRASEKLISVILPILEEDHWPVWNAKKLDE